jgi:hypothetical protein
MKRMLIGCLFALGIAVPAVAGDYLVRHEIAFPGAKDGIVHVNPYPTSKRAASIWGSDACWRGCASSCAWHMEACVSGTDADLCRPTFDACNRSCQRSCRTSGGPLLPDFLDW